MARGNNEPQPGVGGPNGRLLPAQWASKRHQKKQDGGCKWFCHCLSQQPAKVIHEDEAPVSHGEHVVHQSLCEVLRHDQDVLIVA